MLGGGQTSTADLAPDAQVETPAPKELSADQPDIHNQEQHEENQVDVQVDEQHQYPTRLNMNQYSMEH